MLRRAGLALPGNWIADRLVLRSSPSKTVAPTAQSTQGPSDASPGSAGATAEQPSGDGPPGSTGVLVLLGVALLWSTYGPAVRCMLQALVFVTLCKPCRRQEDVLLCGIMSWHTAVCRMIRTPGQ